MTATPEESTPGNSGASTTRRAVLVGAGAGAVAVVAAGCTNYGSAPAPKQGAVEPTGPLAPVADIPVGGGKLFPDKAVVVTQPVAGTVKVFSDVCTHQGCHVNRIANGFIGCPCHGSQFAIADGVPTSASLAKRKLDERPFTVDGGEIVLT